MGDARGKEREEGKGDRWDVSIRRDLIEKEKEINVEDEGVVVGEVRRGSEKWRIIGVYVSKGVEVTRNSLKKWVDKREKEMILIGGDFNARTGK